MTQSELAHWLWVERTAVELTYHELDSDMGIVFYAEADTESDTEWGEVPGFDMDTSSSLETGTEWGEGPLFDIDVEVSPETDIEYGEGLDFDMDTWVSL